MKRFIGSSTWVWAFTVACGGTGASTEGFGSAEESGVGEDASASAGSSESGSASAEATSADTGAGDRADCSASTTRTSPRWTGPCRQ